VSGNPPTTLRPGLGRFLQPSLRPQASHKYLALFAIECINFTPTIETRLLTFTRTTQTMKLLPSLSQILVATSWLTAVSQAHPTSDNAVANLRSTSAGVLHLSLDPSTPLSTESLVPNESHFIILQVNESTAATVRSRITNGNAKRLDDAGAHAVGDVIGEVMTIALAILFL